MALLPAVRATMADLTASQFRAFCFRDNRSETFEELERRPYDKGADSVYGACTWCGAEGIYARIKDPSLYVQLDTDDPLADASKAVTVGNPGKFYHWRQGEGDR